jgi:hypothetical protein
MFSPAQASERLMTHDLPAQQEHSHVIISVGGATFSYREYLRWDAHWITKT